MYDHCVACSEQCHTSCCSPCTSHLCERHEDTHSTVTTPRHYPFPIVTTSSVWAVRVAIFSHRWPARYCLIHNVYRLWQLVFDTEELPAASSAVVYKWRSLQLSTRCSTCRSSLIRSRSLTTSQHHRNMGRTCIIEAQLGFHSNTGSSHILIQCEHCLANYVYSPLDFWLTATWSPRFWILVLAHWNMAM